MCSGTRSGLLFVCCRSGDGSPVLSSGSRALAVCLLFPASPGRAKIGCQRLSRLSQRFLLSLPMPQVLPGSPGGDLGCARCPSLLPRLCCVSSLLSDESAPSVAHEAADLSLTSCRGSSGPRHSKKKSNKHKSRPLSGIPAVNYLQLGGTPPAQKAFCYVSATASPKDFQNPTLED